MIVLDVKHKSNQTSDMKEPKEVDDSDFRKIDPMLVNSNKPVYKFYKSAHKRACNYRQDKRRR